MSDRFSIDVHLTEAERIETMKAELRAGLTQPRKEIPPKYFYDEVGSELFERITELPEYYLTRVETRILRANAERIVERVRPRELLELGSGYSTKTRILLEAMRAGGDLGRYLAIDVSEPALRGAAERLQNDFPEMSMHAVVGDFTRHLDRIPTGDRRLVAFLGSTLGNFDRAAAISLLGQVAAALGPDDAFLLGTDLVKDTEVLERAYNDLDGVTAEFNRNILNVVNRSLDCWLPVRDFEHRAFFDEQNSWIEMRLHARCWMAVRIPGLSDDEPFVLKLEEDEEIRTEISCKYTRPAVEAMLAEAGLHLLEWWTDDEEMFALSLAVRAL